MTMHCERCGGETERTIGVNLCPECHAGVSSVAETVASDCTIPAMCAAWLKDNGYDGLCDPEMECGCSVIDLMPCDMPGLNTCVPAHKEMQNDGDWIMLPGKIRPHLAGVDAEAERPTP